MPHLPKKINILTPTLIASKIITISLAVVAIYYVIDFYEERTLLLSSQDLFYVFVMIAFFVILEFILGPPRYIIFEEKQFYFQTLFKKTKKISYADIHDIEVTNANTLINKIINFSILVIYLKNNENGKRYSFRYPTFQIWHDRFITIPGLPKDTVEELIHSLKDFSQKDIPVTNVSFTQTVLRYFTFSRY